MNHLRVLLLLLTLPGAPIAAQSAMALNGAYRVMGIRNESGCVGPSPSVTAITSGSIAFAPNDTFTWSFAERTICVGAAPASGTSAGTTGTYQVETDGLVELGWGPSARAEDVAHIRPDGAVLIATATAALTPLATFVAIRGGTNLGNGTLAGAHHVVRLVHDHRATGLVVQLEFGSITFLANGTWTETGRRAAIPALTSTPYARNGTFAVHSDGTLDLGGSANGGVAASGEIASWVETNGTVTAWAIAVRQGNLRTAAALLGDFGLVGHALESGNAAVIDNVAIAGGSLALTPLSPLSAAFAATLAERDRGRTSLEITQGAFDLVQDPASPPGRYDVHIGSELLPEVGAVSANGNFVIHAIAELDPSGPEGYLQLHVGMRRAPWPVAFGRGTPGTGGLPPWLQGSGGFPLVGNANFALAVGSARPGAAGLLGVALASGALPFAGGMLWLDLGSLSTIALPIGANGAATLPFPVPATAALAGLQFFAQMLVLDPVAAGGVAMSNGLRVTLGR